MAKRTKPAAKASPAKKAKQAEEEAEEVEVEEEEVKFHFCLPDDENTYSTITRDAFRAPTCQGRFIVQKQKKEQTASMLLARVLNGHLRSKPGFKKAFKKAFNNWASKPCLVNKKVTRSHVLVNEYSRFFSTVVTAMKKEWYMHHTTLLDASDTDNMFERLVIMTRVTYCKDVQALVVKPGTFKQIPEKEALKKFKAAYEVSS